MGKGKQALMDNDAQDESHLSDQLQKRQIAAILLCQLNEAVQITTPYTLCSYMVRTYLGAASDGSTVAEERIGRLTGILAAAFCAAQFLTSYPWGWISERVGRKPVVIVSNISSLVSVVAFGMSTSFAPAVVARLMGGTFNFTFGCVKSMIGESYTSKAQARALGLLSTAWGVGAVMGPALGGALARPCDWTSISAPMCGDEQLFQTRPYLLPCLAVGLLSLVATCSSIFLLPETLPRLTSKQYTALRSADEEALKLEGGLHDGGLEGGGLELELMAVPKERCSPQAASAHAGAARRVQRGDSAHEFYTGSRPVLASSSRLPATQESGGPVHPSQEVSHCSQASHSGAVVDSAAVPARAPPPSTNLEPTPSPGRAASDSSLAEQQRAGLPRRAPSAALSSGSPRQTPSPGSGGAADAADRAAAVVPDLAVPDTGAALAMNALHVAASGELLRPSSVLAAMRRLQLDEGQQQSILRRGLAASPAAEDEPGAAAQQRRLSLEVARTASAIQLELDAEQQPRHEALSSAASLQSSLDAGAAAALGASPHFVSEEAERLDHLAGAENGAELANLDTTGTAGWGDHGFPHTAGLAGAQRAGRAGWQEPETTVSAPQAGSDTAGPTGWAEAGRRLTGSPTAGASLLSTPSDWAGADGQPSAPAAASQQGAGSDVAHLLAAGLLAQEDWSTLPLAWQDAHSQQHHPDSRLGPIAEASSLLQDTGAPAAAAADFEAPPESQHLNRGSRSPWPQRPRLVECRDSAKSLKDMEKRWPWWRDRDIQLTIGAYGMIAWLFNYCDELVPIYASAPLHDSGVGLQSSQLALPLSLSGLVLMAWAVFAYPLCQQRFGTVASVRAGLLAGCPLIMSIPVATLVGANKLAAQLYLCVSLSLKNVAATHAFTSSMILVNHAGRHALGPVNGAGQMLASFVRAIGPALAGVVWGFSLHMSLPGSQFVPFATAAIVALLNQFVYLLVSPSLANI